MKHALNEYWGLTFSSCPVIRTCLHLLKHILRFHVPPCHRCNLFSLLRLFKPNILQPTGHIETVVPASIIKVRFILPKPFCRLLCPRGDRNKRFANVEDVIPKRLQRRDACSYRYQALDIAFEWLRSPNLLSLVPHLPHWIVRSSGPIHKFLSKTPDSD